MMFKIIILKHKNVETKRIYVIHVTTAQVNTVYFHNEIKNFLKVLPKEACRTYMLCEQHTWN
jgi:hypothetical protein